MKFLRRLALPVFVLLAWPALAEIMVDEARITLGIGTRPGVMHATIMNHGNSDNSLIGASSSAFSRIELHTHEKSPDGMMRMRRVEGYDLPQNGTLELVPRGDHLMLFGFKGKVGDTVSVTLQFADGQSKRVDVKTRARQKRETHHMGRQNRHKGH